MIPRQFSRDKFLSLSLKRRHKNAADLLKAALIKDRSLLNHYNQLALWLNLSSVTTEEEIYDRYHMHITQAALTLKEHHFLPEVRRYDPLVQQKALPVAVYLDHLRSAHNVGSILRTAESFGIMQIGFSEQTPTLSHPKVIDIAKGSAHLLSTCSFLDLPRPLIALETHQKAHSIFSFSFPETFTLILGNEEYGISNALLQKADQIVHIPLYGTKNSLNVSAAFAITAAVISEQLRRF